MTQETVFCYPLGVIYEGEYTPDCLIPKLLEVIKPIPTPGIQEPVIDLTEAYLASAGAFKASAWHIVDKLLWIIAVNCKPFACLHHDKGQKTIIVIPDIPAISEGIAGRFITRINSLDEYEMGMLAIHTDNQGKTTLIDRDGTVIWQAD